MGRLPKLLHVARGWPRSRAFLREAADERVADRRAYLRSMAGLARTLRTEGIAAPLQRVAHHRAHAASARLALPAGRGVALTADGMGEWTTAADVAPWKRLPPPAACVAASYPRQPRQGVRRGHRSGWASVPRATRARPWGSPAYGDRRRARSPGSLRPAACCAFDDAPPPARRPRAPRLPMRGEGTPLLRPPRRGRSRPGRAVPSDPLRGSRHRARGARDPGRGRGVGPPGRAPPAGAASGRAPRAGGRALLELRAQRRLGAGPRRRGRPLPVAGDAGAAWGAAAEVHRRRTGRPPHPLGSLRLGHTITAAEATAACAAGRARARRGRRRRGGPRTPRRAGGRTPARGADRGGGARAAPSWDPVPWAGGRSSHGRPPAPYATT